MAENASNASKSKPRHVREDEVRAEYKNAGKLQGLALAWQLVKRLREHYASGFLRLAEAGLDGHDARAARDSVRIAELMLAREVKRLYPKSGVAELVALGYIDEERKGNGKNT